METPTLTVQSTRKDHHHSVLQAKLEQKTMAILETPGKDISSSLRALGLYAETLCDMGVINSDERRANAFRAREYADIRTTQLIETETFETMSIFGIICFISALMIVICCIGVLLNDIALHHWIDNKQKYFLEGLPQPLRIGGWLILAGVTLVYIGSGFRSAFEMVCRWKKPIFFSTLFACAFVIFDGYFTDLARFH